MDASISLEFPTPLNGKIGSEQYIHGKKGSSETTIGPCTATCATSRVLRDVTAKKFPARRRPLKQLIPLFGFKFGIYKINW